MRSLNRVLLIGRLGKDPDVRKMEGNITKVSFPMATSDNYKDKTGNWQEQTEWHNVVMWRMVAERAERDLKKGSNVYIEGKLRTRSWDDQSGNKRYTTEVIADSFILLDKREYSGERPGQEAEGSDTPSGEDQESALDHPEGGEDLPF
jgi:single-strand DNA-binding protein